MKAHLGMWSMATMARRAALAMGFGVVGGFLLWYAVVSYQVGARHTAAVRGMIGADPFPQKWLWEGYARLWDDLDPQGAEAAFRKALERHSAMVDAWWGLVRTQLELQKPEEAQSTLRWLSHKLQHVTTWKWQECLAAYDLGDEGVLASCLAFVLDRIPQRSPDAVFLAFQYWKSWDKVADHVPTAQHEALLRHLMRAGEWDAAYSLWCRMEREGTAVDQKTAVGLCHGLLSRQRIREAKTLWQHSMPPVQGPLYNGGFEEPPMGQAFGWRLQTSRDVVVERSVIEPFEGRYSLHVRFLGTANTAFAHVSQVVPVNPDTPYRLRFARKSRGLTTDQGVFLEVVGYGCSGLSVRSDPVLGTQSWTQESLEFHVPSACEAAWVRLRRKESLKFDNKIFGDYWLDGLVMEVP